MLVERYKKWHNFPCRVTRFPCFSFLYLEIQQHICLSYSASFHLPTVKLIVFFSLYLAIISFLYMSIFVVPPSVSLIFYPFRRLSPTISRWKTRWWKRLQQKKKIAWNLRLLSETYLPSVALFLMNSDMNLLEKEFSGKERSDTIWIRTIGSTFYASTVWNFNFA